MSCLRKFSILLLLVFSVCCFAGNAARIAVVDLERVFKEYYKSKIAEEMIRKQADAYRKYLIRLNEEMRRLSEAARTARSNALNIALSPAEKARAEQELQNRNNAVKEKEAEIKLFVNERSADMRRLENSKRAEIMKEIRAQISKQAAAGGFHFVFDSAGRTMNDQPAILYFPEKCDITSAVIRELNRTRTQVKK